jgi:hypothetical protein
VCFIVNVVTWLSRPPSQSGCLTFSTYPRQEALASAKWIYSNAQRTANYEFRRRLELYVDNPLCTGLERGFAATRGSDTTIHLREYNQHREIIRKFNKNLPPRNSGTQVEGDERKKPDETQEALEWIARSYEKEMTSLAILLHGNVYILIRLGHFCLWEPTSGR